MLPLFQARPNIRRGFVSRAPVNPAPSGSNSRIRGTHEHHSNGYDGVGRERPTLWRAGESIVPALESRCDAPSGVYLENTVRGRRRRAADSQAMSATRGGRHDDLLVTASVQDLRKARRGAERAAVE